MNVIAPFTEDQVKSINEFQTSAFWHPFTCGNDSCHHVSLIARKDGLYCPQCQRWLQTWCHDFMADGSWELWKELREHEREVIKK